MEIIQESVSCLSLAQAISEASRCLYCWHPPCVLSCPTGIEIPKFIKRIETEDMRGAAAVILKDNILGGTCGRVCPVEELCEKACVLNQLEQRPVSIGKLQRFAIDSFLTHHHFKPRVKLPSKQKVAIIGSGPAGLSCAATLAKAGIEACIFEKKELPGGLSTYCIPSFREPLEVALREVEEIQNLGVEIQTKKELGRDIELEGLLKEFEAVFLATGLSGSPRLGMAHEEYFLDALQFLSLAKLNPLSLSFCKHIVIIGLGNSAIDCALVAKKIIKANVSIIYRKRLEDSHAYPAEIEKLMKETINIQTQSTVTAAVIEENRLIGVYCSQLDDPGCFDKRRRLKEKKEFFLPVDLVVRATGQQKPFWLQKMHIELDEKGFIKVNEKYETSVPRVYAGGDCIRTHGLFSTVHAVEDGKRAAFYIAQSFQKKVFV
ncbi:FAD-dependent oxidoreductase [Methylacidiphilum caldifontis]|uniref:dihydrouracil dehydrogenase (NAD(+)) n=1 Tax=Methylacidiphilum caldifontis TaxID=2795386 RepID=A0A4Y8PHA1_9BACT|nr:FAD-dependent oxidoreductase [Methylacidiphilum caldifontis]TFE71068.1 NADH-dependent dihydropyrimidine dehydrogenase subunit PreT [Methylacidiphilum caldifontis]